MSLPPDHLRPIYRQRPGNGGVFTIALDPREAEFVLARGWALHDGVRYRTSTEGCGDEIDWDGRRMIRCDALEATPEVQADPTDRWSLPRILRLLRAA